MAINVFTEALRRQLDSRGMTQRELAEACGVTEAALCRYVRGDRVPRLNTAMRISHTLGMTLDEFLYEKEADRD